MNLYANNIGTIPCNFSGTTSYGYDDLYQLTSADHPETTTLTDETYNYDQVGNRISDSSVTGAISYNPNNELTGHSTVSYEYDANGNTTKKTEGTGSQGVPVPLVTTYHYNAKNRLSQVDLPDGRTATYSYDPFGRRISKTIGTTTTYYLYADEGLIGEYSNTGSWQKSYGWQPNGMWGTNPLYQRNSTGVYYYHNDHLGTPQRLTDATTGEIVWSAGYQAFGQATVDPLSTVENNLRFPGQYFDSETNLHYNWNRTYDPQSGRYTQTDPIGFRGRDLNLYRYAQNSPIYWSDLAGLTASCPARVGEARANTETFHRYPKRSGEVLFHCGFECYNENRTDRHGPSNPSGQCCYDENGDLVDECHEYPNCAGSPDDKWNHFYHDRGGIVHEGFSASYESMRHYKDKLDEINDRYNTSGR